MHRRERNTLSHRQMDEKNDNTNMLRRDLESELIRRAALRHIEGGTTDGEQRMAVQAMNERPAVGPLLLGARNKLGMLLEIPLYCTRDGMLRTINPGSAGFPAMLGIILEILQITQSASRREHYGNGDSRRLRGGV